MAAASDDLLDYLTTAVVVADRDLTVRYLNAAAEDLLGASARAAIGQAVTTVITDPALGARLEHALAEAQPFSAHEYEFATTDARTQTVDLTATPFGEPPTRLLMELTGRDRHLRISREESAGSRHAASRSLVRGLAHEIKNPLGGLRGAAQLLERELDDEGLREYTRVIIGEADRLAGLVDAMLGPTRAPRRDILNVHRVTDRVLQLVGAEAPAGITMVREYDPSLPEISGDEDQLVQAVLNLARNALQAMDEPGRLTARTRIERQVTIAGVRHRQVVCIDIVDTGPGVDASLREQIFLPLVTTRADGTGLGLPIAQGLVARHGGTLDCESAPGATVFTVRLPVAEAT